MSELTAPLPAGGRQRPQAARAFAALDLGTNNCRLLIAKPAAGGFRVVDSFSRIVRLGEGLTASGRLGHGAMDRALEALKICAEKIERRGVRRTRAVATQACRLAANGADFIDRVATETGLSLKIISPKEEARLSVAGCLNLLDPAACAALVIDVGGGSTELSWIDLSQANEPGRREPPPVRAWHSIPVGVVTLAERFPEEGDRMAWYRHMVEAVKAELSAFHGADSMHPVFDRGGAHMVGTSGAITSLAGLHLNLPRYNRALVDGVWMSRADCAAAADRLIAQTREERAREPCIGPDRADLVLAGAAILQAVQELWPCARVRVADRGLREGLLLEMMARRGRRGGQRRGQRETAVADAATQAPA